MVDNQFALSGVFAHFTPPKTLPCALPRRIPFFPLVYQRRNKTVRRWYAQAAPGQRAGNAGAAAAIPGKYAVSHPPEVEAPDFTNAVSFLPHTALSHSAGTVHSASPHTGNSPACFPAPSTTRRQSLPTAHESSCCWKARPRSWNALPQSCAFRCRFTRSSTTAAIGLRLS